MGSARTPGGSLRSEGTAVADGQIGMLVEGLTYELVCRVLFSAGGLRMAPHRSVSTAGARGRPAEPVESMAWVWNASGGNRTALLRSDGAAVSLGRTACS